MVAIELATDKLELELELALAVLELALVALERAPQVHARIDALIF